MVRVIWVSLALCAVASRVPHVELGFAPEATLEKQRAHAPDFVAVPQVEAKRALTTFTPWSVAPASTAHVAMPQAQLTPRAGWFIVDPRERARQRANPAHGPPAQG
jgi:hypothetical protein